MGSTTAALRFFERGVEDSDRAKAHRASRPAAGRETAAA
jgi:hypothetical protein